MARLPVLRRPTDEEARFIGRGLPPPKATAKPVFRSKGVPGIDYPVEEPAVTVVGQRIGTIEPWKFGLALALLAVVWFMVPKGSHWVLALLLVGGALAASNEFARKHKLPLPLESIGF